AAAFRAHLVPIVPAQQTRAEKKASEHGADARTDESPKHPPPAASAQSPAADQFHVAAIAKAAARKSQPPIGRTTKPPRSVRKSGAELRAVCRTTIPRQTRADLAW